MIPETIGSYDFGKGPYYSNKGDFCTAGYVGYTTLNVLDKSTVKIEGGQFNSYRGVAMIDLLSDKAKQKGTSAYVAGEALYNDGPFDTRCILNALICLENLLHRLAKTVS